MIIRVHYNRQTVHAGKPWTVHTSRICRAAKHVYFNVPVETEEKPNKRTNPRYFIRCDGTLSWIGNYAYID